MYSISYEKKLCWGNQTFSKSTLHSKQDQTHQEDTDTEELVCREALAIDNQAEEPGVNGKGPERQTVSESEPQDTTKQRETTNEQEHPSPSRNSSFVGEVLIDLKRFTDSDIALVECPRCSRTRSLSPVKGVLRIPAHTPRIQQTALSSKRWSATGRTDWSVVGG